MLIDLDELRKRLKSLGLSVYRDKPPKDAALPYVIYSFVSTTDIWASGVVGKSITEYQVSLFTKGVERELTPVSNVLSDIPHTGWASQQGDENDDTVTNYYTMIEVKANE